MIIKKIYKIGGQVIEQKCHDLALTFLNNRESMCKEIEFNPDALHEIKSKIDAEDLLTFAAVYGDDEWAMDVSTCLSITIQSIIFLYVQIWMNLRRTKKTETV